MGNWLKLMSFKISRRKLKASVARSFQSCISKLVELQEVCQECLVVCQECLVVCQECLVVCQEECQVVCQEECQKEKLLGQPLKKLIDLSFNTITVLYEALKLNVNFTMY